MGASRLTELVDRCWKDPAAISEVRAEADALAIDADKGSELERATAMQWRIVVMNDLLKNPPDDDSVREYYGELCDRYRDDVAFMQKLKPIGEEIRRLESEGTLPSTLVARSDRRPRKP